MKTQISNAMLLAIIINLVYAKAIGVTQGILARQSGSDMWLVTIFSTIFGLIMMWLTVVIVKRTPEKNILEQTKLLIGKWGEKLLAFVLFIFFLEHMVGL
ncbi:GerAB/ArcD/ProY family transporter [Anaerobacillus sp. CMMVII]|nr:GerAB/ArcD/ProY family transporter [Anaerobacillus sp. CMMVII]